jgi:hypothetical protein
MMTDAMDSNQILKLTLIPKELPDVSKLSHEECALDFTM